MPFRGVEGTWQLAGQETTYGTVLFRLSQEEEQLSTMSGKWSYSSILECALLTYSTNCWNST